MPRLLSVLAVVSALSVIGGAQASNVYRIAYTAWRHHQTQIFTVSSAGGEMRQLTDGRVGSKEPALSRDGSRIAYAWGSFRRGTWDIWTMNSDGSDKKRLTFTPHVREESPSWSPDGSEIAFTTASGVWVMNREGGDRRRITWRVGFGAPSWSPDGKEIVVSSGRLYTVSVIDGRVRRLPKGYTPAWSPDGKSIVFSRELNGRAFSLVDLWLVDTDGTGLRPLTNTPLLFEFWPAWSPDGSQIAFAATKGGCGHARLFIMNANGSGRHWLRVATGSAPSWQRLHMARRHGHCGF